MKLVQACAIYQIFAFHHKNMAILNKLLYFMTFHNVWSVISQKHLCKTPKILPLFLRKKTNLTFLFFLISDKLLSISGFHKLWIPRFAPHTRLRQVHAFTFSSLARFFSALLIKKREEEDWRGHTLRARCFRISCFLLRPNFCCGRVYFFKTGNSLFNRNWNLTTETVKKREFKEERKLISSKENQ